MVRKKGANAREVNRYCGEGVARVYEYRKARRRCKSTRTSRNAKKGDKNK
jgi:hypothetical protein